MSEGTFPLVTNENPFDPLFEKDVVVIFADEVERRRFVTRNGQFYSNLNKRPAIYVFDHAHPWTDLDDDARLALANKQLTNRSVWIRNPGYGEEKDDFVEVVRGGRDHGGLLFEEAFASQLLSRANRLDKAFEMLGLRHWKICASETSNLTRTIIRRGAAGGSVGIGGTFDKEGNFQKDDEAGNDGEASNDNKGKKLQVGAGVKMDVNNKKFDHSAKTLTSDLSVNFEESRRGNNDLPYVRKKIAALGLLDDQVVRKVLLAREDGRKVEEVTLNMDLDFTKEIMRKFDLAVAVAAQILFVTAKFESQYHSFQKSVETLKQSVKIEIGD